MFITNLCCEIELTAFRFPLMITVPITKCFFCGFGSNFAGIFLLEEQVEWKKKTTKKMAKKNVKLSSTIIN